MNRMTIKEYIKSITPKPVWSYARKIYYKFKKEPIGESSKAKPRRIKEKFFQKYCEGHGLDVGCGDDLLASNCRGWDLEDGDAQYLYGLTDSSYDFVYSSHALEDMIDPSVALENWWRVLKAGGFLILYIPHRELYEKRNTLPSQWNPDHKHFFLLEKDDPPDTIGILSLIERTLTHYEIIYAKVCSEGHTISDPTIHSDGEYSIEIVIRKKNV
jgi:SAM-dependent methyltransferase